MTPNTTLLRQVHPNFVINGELTSQAFVPFPKDDGGLSVNDGDRITAAAAFVLYTEILKLSSAGVWGVMCSEATGVGLTTEADPQPENPTHALIRFPNGGGTQNVRALAKRLKQFAQARGRLYAP